MSIVDILIIILLLIYAIRGFTNGALKEAILFIGGLVVLVLAYFLKNPVSMLLYEHLPFFKFGGLLSGISVLNVVIFEILAFLIVASILMLIYKIILGITNLIETVLNMTFILAIPSKLIGLVLGFIEGLVVIFILLFITYQFSMTKSYIDESKFGTGILTSTPVLSNVTKSAYESIREIYEVAERYKNSTDRNAANLEALDTILKYKLIEPDTANYLVASNKLEIDGALEIINKYYQNQETREIE